MEPEASMEGLCPICLDLLHRPHSLQPCQHLFCDPCLRRLAENSLLLPSEYNGNCLQKCPVCRSPIEDCHLDQELHDSIEDQHQDLYIQRQQVEMNSGIFNLPLPLPPVLPPVDRTFADLFNEFQEFNWTGDPEPSTRPDVSDHLSDCFFRLVFSSRVMALSCSRSGSTPATTYKLSVELI